MHEYFKSAHKRTHSKVDNLPSTDANDDSEDTGIKRKKRDIIRAIWNEGENRHLRLMALKKVLVNLQDYKNNYEKAATAFHRVNDKKMSNEFRNQARVLSEAIEKIQKFFEFTDEKEKKMPWYHERNMFIDDEWEKLKKSSNHELQFQIQAIEKDITLPSESSSIRMLDTIHGNLKVRLEEYAAYFQELEPHWLKIVESNFIEGVKTYLSTLPDVVKDLQDLLKAKQDLGSIPESNQDSLNQSQALIDKSETQINQKLKVLVDALDKTNKLRSATKKNP